MRESDNHIKQTKIKLFKGNMPVKLEEEKKLKIEKHIIYMLT